MSSKNIENQNRWILVTGASTGIGLACVEYLSNRGFSVYAGVRNEKAMENLSKIPNVVPIILDVTKPHEIQNAVALIKQNKTGLFGLVNNAGIAVAGPLMEITDDDFQSQFNVSLFGVHRVTKALYPFLLESQGRIVMMSSDSGFFATPFFGPYCSAKFALEGYSDSLRREFCLTGIKVILIQPGRITTPIWDKGETLLKGLKPPVDSKFTIVGQQVGEYAVRKGRTAGWPPSKVAEVVYQAFMVPKPKVRYLVAEHKFKYRMIKILPATKVDEMASKELLKMQQEGKNKT